MKKITILLVAVMLTGCQTLEEKKQYNAWYAGLSPEEKQVELQRRHVKLLERQHRSQALRNAMQSWQWGQQSNFRPLGVSCSSRPGGMGIRHMNCW